MEKGNISLELKKVIYLCMITSLTIFSLFLVGLDLLLGWEIWMLPVILAGMVICWALFIMDKVPRRTQIYICGVLAVFFVFYYCIKINTTYDCGTVIVIMIVLFSCTREKALVWFGMIGSAVALIFHLVMVSGSTGLNFSVSSVVRTIMVFFIIPFTVLIIEQIVKAWEGTQKKYQETIDILTDENERANNFLANVSHEIRTPISAVLGLSYVLENEDLPPEDVETVKAISEAGHRASEQISDILDFTEVDMKKVALSNETSNNKADLVLLDYEMPVVNGPTFFEMLKSDEDSDMLPVIFLTGQQTKSSVLTAMELKPVDYLLKSITKGELREKLECYFTIQKAKE